MAFRNLVQRILNISKTSSQAPTNCRISSSLIPHKLPPNPSKSSIDPDPGDNAMFRRFLHKRAAFPPEMKFLGDNLMERIRDSDLSRSRIRFDGLIRPKTEELTVEDARKVLRVAQLEVVKSKLREIESDWIPYSEFVGICGHGCSDLDQGLGFAKMLDQSGSVIVLGNAVFLRPEEVAKTISGLFPISGINPNNPRKKEFEEMEKQKSAIDKEAEHLVRRELWCGLGFMIVQTAGLMRLTFWELSWDVMEPICFYLTSIYFMAGYTFFLRTSKEPSFEGFFHSRFVAKQKRLMTLNYFDIDKYNELRKCFQPCSLPSAADSESLNCERMHIGALHH